VARGANLESGLQTPAQVDALVTARLASPVLRLLFVGVDWVRKGGDVAFAAVQQLRQQGVDATLTIVGCQTPAGVRSQPFVQVHRFLRRNHPAELQQLHALFSQANLFILPTRAEAFGIVFAEAASFGLPSLACNTGGVSAAIESGKTGVLLDVAASAADFVAQINTLRANPTAYRQMCLAAFAKYQTQLNWGVIARRIHAEIEQCLAQEGGVG